MKSLQLQMNNDFNTMTQFHLPVFYSITILKLTTGYYIYLNDSLKSWHNVKLSLAQYGKYEISCI